MLSYVPEANALGDFDGLINWLKSLVLGYAIANTAYALLIFTRQLCLNS
jgi:hypothetical protein